VIFRLVGVGFHTDALSPMGISLHPTSAVAEALADKTARQESATTFHFTSAHSEIRSDAVKILARAEFSQRAGGTRPPDHYR